MKQTAAEETVAVNPHEDVLLRRFPGWSLPHWCIVAFAASFLVLGLLPEGQLTDLEVPNGAETVRVARSLASNGTFANPFASLPTGATAHVAPVYPFLYSLVLRVSGAGHSALQFMWALNVAFLATQMALLSFVSDRLRLGVAPGVAAAALGTISLHAPIDTRWETFLSGMLLLVTFLITLTALRDASINKTITAGVLWGVLILTNPITLQVLGGWIFCFAQFPPAKDSAKRWRRSLSMLAVALLVISPWIARNYVRFGTFIFVRDNLGLELYTGNNSCAAPDLHTNIESGCHARTHPNAGPAVAAQLAAAGEIAFNREKLREASGWIASHPAAFLKLTIRRVRLFWFPAVERRWEAAFVWLVTLLSLPGLWMIRRKSSRAAGIIASTWLLFPLIYYFVPFEPRYRYPIYWTSLLPAGCAVVEMIGRLPFIRPAGN